VVLSIVLRKAKGHHERMSTPAEFFCYTHLRPNGEIFYVGKGSGKRSHNFRTGRSQYHKNIVAKHGAENIIVSVIPCASEAEAFSREMRLIKDFLGIGYPLCNMSDGGEGPSGAIRSAATKAKIGAAKKGKPLSAAHIAAMSAGKKGKPRPELKGLPAWNKGRKLGPLSAETKDKISAARKANTKPSPLKGRPSGRKGLPPWNKGKKRGPQSQETIDKRVATRKANAEARVNSASQ
jgi:NUMOD3 motif